MSRVKGESSARRAILHGKSLKELGGGGAGGGRAGAGRGVVGEGDKPGEAEKAHEFKFLHTAQLAWLSG